MATLDELHAALIKADAAGNTEDAKALADAIRAQPQTPTPQVSPFRSAFDSTMDAAKNLFGPAEAGLNLASGMIAKPISDIAGLAAMGSEMVSPKGGDPLAFKQDVQNSLTYQPRTPVGQAISEYNPLALIGKGVSAVSSAAGNAIRGQEDNLSPRGMAGNAIQEALPTALPLAAMKGASMFGKPVPAPVLQARASGIRMTPSEGNGGLVSTTLEGLSGEPKLAKNISVKNQPAVNDLIAQDVGLPKGSELSRDALYSNISKAGQAYQVVRDSGRVGVDKQYKADLANVSKEYDTASQDFPGDKHPVLKIVDNADVDSFDANSAISKINTLRQDSKDAYSKGNRSEGRASLDVANAIENQLGRFLQRKSLLGDPAAKEALQNFRDARVKIAKNYAAIKALNNETGDINPQAYAKLIDKEVPLTGGAKTVGELAKAFPRSLQKTDRIKATGATFADFAAGALSHEWPLLFARPMTRGVLASQPVQSLIASPSPFSLQANPAIAAGEIGYANQR